MNIKKGTTASKVLSIVLSLLMVLGTIPVQGMVAYAAELESTTRTFSVQYLKKDVVQSGVEIKIQPDIDKDNTFSGVTDEYGICESDVTWEYWNNINGASEDDYDMFVCMVGDCDIKISYTNIVFCKKF